MKTPLKKSFSSEIQNNLRSEDPVYSKNWLTSLISLGAKGYYPLFYNEWIITNLNESQKSKITGKERKLLMQIKSKLSSQSTFERKKIILASMSETNRNLFIKHFMFLVETHVLDKTPKLH